MARKKIGLQIEERQFSIDAAEVEDRSKPVEGETVTVGGEEFTVFRFTCSSEYPVRRIDWNTGEEYLEVLSHDPKDVDLRRFKDGASVRDTHTGPQVGVLDEADITGARKLGIAMRFSKRQAGQDFERDVRTRVVRNVSIRYLPKPKPKISRDEKTGLEVRTFKWEAIHMSFEPDGADPKVGVGRENEQQQRSVDEIEVEATETPRSEERSTMTPEELAAQEQVNAQRATAAATVAVANRNKEVLEIQALARQHGVDEDKISDLITRGISKQDAAVEILTLTTPEARKAQTADPLADASRRERKDLQTNYSVARAFQQAAILRTGGKLSGREGEWHNRLRAARAVDEGHFLIPWRTHTDDERAEQMEKRARELGARAMGTGLLGAGAELVYDAQPVDILDAFRPRLPLLTRGATFMPGLRGPVPMPRFTSDAVLHWADENPAVAVAATAVGTAVAWLKEKTLQGKLPVPKQLLQTSNFDIENRLRRMLAAAAAVKIQKAALHGTGTEHQPLGLWNLPGVHTVAPADTSGHKPAYGDLVDMSTAIAEADADGSRMGFIVTPGLAGYFRKNLEFSAAGSTKMWTGDDMNGQLAGFGASATNCASSVLGSGTNEHAAFFGAWESYNVGLFGDALEILADPYTMADEAQLVLHLFMMADAGTAVPECFSILTPAKVA